MDDNTLSLSKPLPSHRGDLLELHFDYPTGNSFIRYGMPFDVQQTDHEDGSTSNTVKFNPKVMFKFAADMCKLDEITLTGMDGNDTLRMFGVIYKMLNIGRPKTSST